MIYYKARKHSILPHPTEAEAAGTFIYIFIITTVAHNAPCQSLFLSSIDDDNLQLLKAI
jgi:hypothetical protein